MYIYLFWLIYLNTTSAKGQLNSERLFGVIVSTKNTTKKIPGFLPYPLKRGQIKKIKSLIILIKGYLKYLV